MAFSASKASCGRIIQPLRSRYCFQSGRLAFLLPLQQPALNHRILPSTRRGIIYLPAVLQPSFWKSLVPTFLRRRDPDTPEPPKKGWNPATFYIWMFLLIGSQAIQLLGLKGSFAKFSQETEAKLELLRDIVRKIQNGEQVDVEKLLGTGDEKREREWEDVLKELESEDLMFRERRKKWRHEKREDESSASDT